MKTSKKLTPESLFPRSFTFKKDSHIVSGVMQPYCVGMYCAINDSDVSDTIQLNLQHKEITKWFKKVKGKFEKDGYNITVSEDKLGNYLKSEEIENYVN